jgi:hypothetical protein
MGAGGGGGGGTGTEIAGVRGTWTNWASAGEAETSIMIAESACVTPRIFTLIKPLSNRQSRIPVGMPKP